MYAFTHTLIALLSFSLSLLPSLTTASPSRKHARFDRRVLLAERSDASNFFSHPTLEDRSTAAKSPYLTEATKKYAVDGAALPEVTFNIGESYAGLLPIDHTSHRELFFWFAPSKNPHASDEIMIWLNGGPGCSSLDGFFHENGPAIWQPGTFRPVRNTYSWTNLTNVVWVEQPVGTGFSRGTPNVTNEIEVAEQFLGFWRNFVDLFGLHGRKVYITGESYAGMYVPYIAEAMLNKSNTKYFDVNGILIYDPSIGYDQIMEQVPTVAFMDAHKDDFPLDDASVANLHNISATCGYDSFLEKGLTFPPSGPLPPPPGLAPDGFLKDSCDAFDTLFAESFNFNPCFDIYQVGQLCPIPWDVLGFPYSGPYLPDGFTQPYFNRTDVKKAIHAPLDAVWTICSSEPVFVGNGDQSLPSALTGGPLQTVIEKTNNVIVGHGLLDMVLIANGSLLTLQNLTWNGAQGFTEPPTRPFYVPYHDDPNPGSVAGAGVYGSWVSERGLTFVTIAFSGHEVPEFQPSSAYRQVEFLLGRIKSLSEVSAFTTQPGYPQPQQPLGNGTGNLLVWQ